LRRFQPILAGCIRSLRVHHLVERLAIDLEKRLEGASIGLLTETGQDLGSLLEVALLDVVARRLGKEEETTGKDHGPGHLNCNRDSVRASIRSVLGAIVDARSKQDANGNAELVARHYRATNLLGSDLGHVQNDDG
jgi:hypothetical protein